MLGLTDRMDPANRKLLFFGVIGLILAGTLISVQETSRVLPVKGLLIVNASSLPLVDEQGASPQARCPTIVSLNVTIDSVRVHRRGSSLLGVTGEWIEDLLQAPRTLDLMKVSSSTVLAMGGVHEGNVTIISLHVASASASFSTNELVTVEVPSEDLKVVVQSLQVRAGSTSTVDLRMEPHVVCAGSDRSAVGLKLILTPVLKVSGLHGP